MKFPDAREVMAFCIMGMFAYGFAKNPHEPLIVGAMIAAFSTAYGFYLGGSKVGSDTATKNADTLAARAAEPAGTPDDPVSVKEAR
ncbi:hypothetical protein [Sphingomonas sp. 1P08PE]|uniref:hypothetical protein n=1 Tax=Sphingomonas sp. 1P08PE TaxID=554122 RepID=UPI0039A0D55C